MRAKRARLERLEAKRHPRSYVAVYEQDGVLWIPQDKDYRNTVSPGGNSKLITRDELLSLEREHTVILVHYVDMSESVL